MDQSTVATVLQSVALSGAVMASSQLPRFFRRSIKFHPLVAQHPESIRKYPGLCESVHELAALEHDGLVTQIMQRIDCIAHADASRNGDASWKISRWSREVETLCGLLCDDRYAARCGQETFATATRLRADALPDVARHLEVVLHNHLLKI